MKNKYQWRYTNYDSQLQLVLVEENTDAHKLEQIKKKVLIWIKDRKSKKDN
jgi:hypothetical protein